jgi:lipopolysaccharide assembly protein A
MKTIIAILIVVLFFVAAMIFSSNNTDVVTINYLIAQGSFNVSLIIGVAFLAGFLLCWCIFYSLYIGLKFKLKISTKKLEQARNDVEQLKEKQLSNV